MNGNGYFIYDAAGRNNFLDNSGHGTVAMSFDGDGQQIKTLETYYDEEFNEFTETKYYVRSTVLGGQVLAEVDEFNSVFRRFVYAGPTVLAWIWGSMGFESVEWEQRDPSGASVRGIGQQELDPLGADAGTHATSVPPTDGPLMSYGSSYSPANPSMTYSVNGIRVSADNFMNFAEVALQDPLRVMEWFARTSATPLGRRNSGVSWGRRFEVIYDANGGIVSHTSEYDAELSQVNYGNESLIYSNGGLPDLTLLPQNPNAQDLISRAIKIITKAKGCSAYLQKLMAKVEELTHRASSDSSILNIRAACPPVR